METATFSPGTLVVYVSGSHGDYEANPLWGGVYGYVVGKVIGKSTSGKMLQVAWENGTKNAYYQRDLRRLVSTPELEYASDCIIEYPPGVCKNIW